MTHLWERECTIQRRHQKLVEVAPSPAIGAAMRERLTHAALRIARGARYDSLGTFEFLVDADGGDDAEFAFIEANPRLQVEHTVTEEVTGVDLVKAQLQLAAGRSLAELGLRQADIAQAARLCDSAANQRRIDGRGRRRAPLGRQAQRFRAARRGRVSASIRSPIPATPPIPGSTRCSPSSSCVRLRPISPTPSTRPIARCASSASRAWRPTWAFSRPC